jgi:hypothetical protein
VYFNNHNLFKYLFKSITQDEKQLYIDNLIHNKFNSNSYNIKEHNKQLVESAHHQRTNINSRIINTFFIYLLERRDRKNESKLKRANLIIEHDSKLNHTYVQETSETTSVKRRYLKVKVKNIGNAIANSCSAKLTFMETDSTIHRKPVLEDRTLIWDNKKEHRKIGIDDYALLYIVFSQDTFQTTQHDNGIVLSDDDKIYAKICTLDSFNSKSRFDVSFAEDGFSIGKAHFKLVVKNHYGESVEAVLKIDVTSDWHELLMEKVS